MRKSPLLAAVVLPLFLPGWGTGLSPAYGQQTDMAEVGAFLAAVKGEIDKRADASKLVAYEVVALRLTHCALLYGVMAENRFLDTLARSTYKKAADVYALSSTTLYPKPAVEYNKAIEGSDKLIESLLRDRRKLFYFMRNCQDLSNPTALGNAITELLLQ